jgi:stage V sporulation protein S
LPVRKEDQQARESPSGIAKSINIATRCRQRTIIMAELTTTDEILKVSATSRSTALAGAIAGVIRDKHYVEVQAIGAGAVNQAVKAIAIARSYLEQDQLDILCAPVFIQIVVKGEERTAVRFAVESRSLEP